MFSWKHYRKSQPWEASLSSLHKCWTPGTRDLEKPESDLPEWRPGDPTCSGAWPGSSGRRAVLCGLCGGLSYPSKPPTTSAVTPGFVPCGGPSPFSLRRCPPALWSSGRSPQGPGTSTEHLTVPVAFSDLQGHRHQAQSTPSGLSHPFSTPGAEEPA